jgi:hypothetical protein
MRSTKRSVRAGSSVSGLTEAIEIAIQFLEVDPYFFRSGYIKTDLLRRLKRAPLMATAADARTARHARWALAARS